MLRSKSPFKKKSPKEPQEEVVTDESRPPMQHWRSVQEFQELRKEQHLLSGNAFAQRRASRERSGTVNAAHLCSCSTLMTIAQTDESYFPETPMTSMGQFIEAGRRDSTTLNSTTTNSTPIKTPKKKKKAAPPPLSLVPIGETLKLVPDGAEYAVPTQREKNESTRHKEMEDMMYDATAEGGESANQSFVSVEPEKNKRPKSPGKKFFDFFKSGASSPKLPDTPEIPATYKAAKILGDESLGKKKGKTAPASKKKTKKDEYDFKCSGPTPQLGSDSFDAPTDREIRGVADLPRYSPTELEIRKVGGRGTIVPMLSTQRTVSETATVMGAQAANVKASELAAKHNSDIFLRTKSLQYMNDSLPPTPPSKESIKTRARTGSNRALVTDYPPRSISTVPEDDDSSPEIPNTAFLGSPTPVPKISSLPKHLAKFTHNDYTDLILNNKASTTSYQASIGGDTDDSVSPSMYNLSPANSSTEKLIESYYDAENNVVVKSSSNSSAVTAQFGGRSRNGSLAPTVCSGRSRNESIAPAFVPSIRSLNRRWSEGSLLSQAQAQKLGFAEVLRPGFYSPANFQVAGFKPSLNVSIEVPLTVGFTNTTRKSQSQVLRLLAIFDFERPGSIIPRSVARG